jgi:hypothetical protein
MISLSLYKTNKMTLGLKIYIQFKYYTPNSVLIFQFWINGRMFPNQLQRMRIYMIQTNNNNATGHLKSISLKMLELWEYCRAVHSLCHNSTNPYQPEQSRYCWEQCCLGSPLLGEIEACKTSHCSSQLLHTLLPHCNKELSWGERQKVTASMSVGRSIQLSIHLSIHLSACQPVSQSASQPVSQSVGQSVGQSLMTKCWGTKLEESTGKMQITVNIYNSCTQEELVTTTSISDLAH